MKIAKTVLIASAFALAAGSVWAADKDKSSSTDKSSAGSTVGNATRSDDSGFAKLDKNKDGYISKLEAKGEAELSKNFDKWDLNNDGKLNRAEYLAAMAKEDAVKAKDKVSDKISGDKASSGSSTKPAK